MKDLEIKELYKVLEEQWGDSGNYINDLIRYSKQQDRRIDKAIEYIKELQELKAIDYLKLYEPQYIDRLLEILKDGDKE